MHYFTLDGDALIRREVKALPAEIEALYQVVRTAYTIKYFRSEWEDESTAPGMGYDYNNSYEIEREPLRNELVICNGALYGFCVGKNLREADKTRVITEADPAVIIRDKDRMACFERWDLIAELPPRHSEYVFLARVCGRDETHRFSIDEFPEHIAEEITDQFFLEDHRGEFNGIFCVTVKVNKALLGRPDYILERLAEYEPVMVRK